MGGYGLCLVKMVVVMDKLVVKFVFVCLVLNGEKLVLVVVGMFDDDWEIF